MSAHGQLLEDYVKALNTHRWEAVQPLIDDSAVFIFSEGTYVGVHAIEAAIRRTFGLISDEHYEVLNKQWTLTTDSVAVCYYHFKWRGVIDGRASGGGGRGTSIVRKASTGWKILHEHLGPAPKE
jgi:ketosteroid isomerase-like protein